MSEWTADQSKDKAIREIEGEFVHYDIHGGRRERLGSILDAFLKRSMPLPSPPETSR